MLVAGGMLVALVPLVQGWAKTYEDPSLDGPEQRERHFRQSDHLRFFGADFRDRLRDAGFRVSEFTADGPDSARYRLAPGEKVFLAEKAG